VSQFAQVPGKTARAILDALSEEHTFPQESDRRSTIPRAATWSTVDGLAGPQWCNLAKEQSTNHNSKTGAQKMQKRRVKDHDARGSVPGKPGTIELSLSG
jgi:hypothetical protein